VAVFAAGAGVLAACSSLPSVSFGYYLTTPTAKVTISRTVGCDPNKEHFVFIDTPAVITTYGADKRFYQPIFIKEIEDGKGKFADTSLGFSYYDDGKLKGINSTTTGQGDTILKAGASIMSAVAVVAIMALDGGNGPCEVLEKWGGGKTVSIVYSAPIDLPMILGHTPPEPKPAVPGQSAPAPGSSVTAQSIPLNAPGYESLLEKLTGLQHPTMEIGSATLLYGGARSGPIDLKSPPTARDEAPIPGAVNLVLQKMATLDVTVTQGDGTAWKTNVLYPTGFTYSLPIPKAELFGTQSLVLSLAESGAITGITYGKTGGAAGALGAAQSIITSLPSQASQTSQLKEQADLLAQQQRLWICRNRPLDCK
jgi:hypothetical protein